MFCLLPLCADGSSEHVAGRELREAAGPVGLSEAQLMANVLDFYDRSRVARQVVLQRGADGKLYARVSHRSIPPSSPSSPAKVASGAG